MVCRRPSSKGISGRRGANLARPLTSCSPKHTVTLVSITGAGYICCDQRGTRLRNEPRRRSRASPLQPRLHRRYHREQTDSSVFGNRFEVCEVARIGQLVVVNDFIMAATPRTCRMKLQPMNPAPPVTKIFIGEQPDRRQSPFELRR